MYINILTCWSLSETFIRRSWYSVFPDLDTTSSHLPKKYLEKYLNAHKLTCIWYSIEIHVFEYLTQHWSCQESGHMRGWVDSCPHLDSCLVDRPCGCKASLIHPMGRSCSLSVFLAFVLLFWSSVDLSSVQKLLCFVVLDELCTV